MQWEQSQKHVSLGTMKNGEIFVGNKREFSKGIQGNRSLLGDVQFFYH
jgi:hypothetical protein